MLCDRDTRRSIRKNVVSREIWGQYGANSGQYTAILIALENIYRAIISSLGSIAREYSHNSLRVKCLTEDNIIANEGVRTKGDQ